MLLASYQKQTYLTQSTKLAEMLSLVGIPFGLAIIHKAFREDKLIRFGSAIEDLIGGRPLPKFLNPDADGYLYIGADPDEEER